MTEDCMTSVSIRILHSKCVPDVVPLGLYLKCTSTCNNFSIIVRIFTFFLKFLKVHKLYLCSVKINKSVKVSIKLLAFPKLKYLGCVNSTKIENARLRMSC